MMTSSIRSPDQHNSTNSELTVAEMVLVSTAAAANWTTDPVPYGAIVVQAWRAFPARFCLDGHPELPDASDIHKPLYRTLRDRDLIESLGQKTFRLTDSGLSTATSIASDDRRISAWRRTISVDVCSAQTTQSVIQMLLDEAGQESETVAKRLLAAVLAIRFLSEEQSAPQEEISLATPTVVGDTEFSVLIPITLQGVRDWMSFETPNGRRALVVRDGEHQLVELILDREDPSSLMVSYGVETFLGQMIDGMAAYDGARITAITQFVIELYNRHLPLETPRIQLKSIECVR
jgi:hypothetical protein